MLPFNMTLKLTSSVFEHNHPIPKRYTCEGDDVSPPLSIEDVPERTQSLVLIVDDPDAPAGTWDHWLLWNITALTRKIEEGKVPTGVILGTNSFGKSEWGGPCPPPGKVHRYVFKLCALDQSLPLREGATKRELERAMNGHILEQTSLIGLYQR